MTTAAATRVPPGRAGILRLRRRLAVAEAGADLLARKLTVLSVEADRLATVTAATGQQWHTAARNAQRSLDRAAQLAGDRGVRLAALAPQARVDVHRTALMGLGYPAGATCDLPARPADEPPPADAALMLAESTVRIAVPAAARHAAAVRAATTVNREAELTRRRLRALQHRRIPGLREALAQAVAQVEELEAADAVLRRWAGRPQG
jgi:V/A-type H+-transporting ATPase subunit D